MRIPTNLVEAIPGTLLEIFHAGKPADRVVEHNLKNHKKWGSRDRRYFADNVYNIVRNYRKLWVLSGLDPQKYMDKDSISLANMKTLAQFHLENKESEVRLSFPEQESYTDWFYELGEEELGDDWQPIAQALNKQAPVFLRTNTLKTTREKLMQALESEQVLAQNREENPAAIELVQRKNVFITKAHKEGLFEVQDLSSQYVAPLLAPKANETVIDACAGAGGKTLHLAALMKNKGIIHSFDIHQRKLDELRKRCDRAGVSIVSTNLLDSNSTIIADLEGQADAILLDVPCTGSGVIRRHPDTKWKLQKEDWHRVLELQQNILQNYSTMLKKGGRLVYATCSVFPSENMNQVTEFLKQNPNFVLSQSKFCRPDIDAGDGFFMALLIKG